MPDLPNRTGILSVEVIQGALEALRKINRDRHVIDHSVPFVPEHDPLDVVVEPTDDIPEQLVTPLIAPRTGA